MPDVEADKLFRKWTGSEADDVHMHKTTGHFDKTLCGKRMDCKEIGELNLEKKPCAECLREFLVINLNRHVRAMAPAMSVKEVNMIRGSSFNVDSDAYNIHESHRLNEAEGKNLLFNYVLGLIDHWELDDWFFEHYNEATIEREPDTTQKEAMYDLD